MKKKQTRVCILMPNMYPLLNPECQAAFGGGEVDMYHVAQKLAEDENYSVSVLVGDFGQPLKETFGRVHVRKLRRDFATKHGLWDKIVKYVDLIAVLLAGKADIYVTKTASELDGWVALLARGIRRKKHVHRMASDKDTNPQNYIDSMGKRFVRLHSYGLFHTDLILAQTPQQQAMLLQNTGLGSIVIKNGFEPQQANLKGKKGILWVSRAVALKRAELFLELAQRLPKEEFTLIMPLMQVANSAEQTLFDAYNKRILHMVENTSNVRYIPQVPFGEIQSYFNAAKLFVNTSEYEGFPNTFIQACLGCTPILSFRVNPDEFITKQGLGAVCNDDMDVAVAFVQSLDDESVAKLGANAARYISQNHNINATIVQYKQAFDALMDKKEKS